MLLFLLINCSHVLQAFFSTSLPILLKDDLYAAWRRVHPERLNSGHKNNILIVRLAASLTSISTFQLRIGEGKDEINISGLSIRLKTIIVSMNQGSKTFAVTSTTKDRRLYCIYVFILLTWLACLLDGHHYTVFVFPSAVCPSHALSFCCLQHCSQNFRSISSANSYQTTKRNFFFSS